MMGHIYVSYSRSDHEVVNRIVGAMEQGGLSVWIDREDIQAGKASKTWRAQIVEAIDTCDAFVLMLSSNSAVSNQVRKEIDLAQDSGRAIFIMRLDSVIKLPAEMRYQLVGLQSIDIQKLGVDDRVNQLIDTLKEHLATPKPDAEHYFRQAQLVIEGVDPSRFDPETEKNLLDLISKLTETPQAQLQISDLNSELVLVGMPAQAAFGLKTLALNLDIRLRQFGIKALRLLGDKKYVNMSPETESGTVLGHRPPGDPTTDAPPPPKKKK